MRVVLDTNVMLVSIPKMSRYRALFEALIQGKFTLIISNEILTEYEEIISQKANNVVALNIINMLMNLGNVEKTEIYFRWDLIEADDADFSFIVYNLSLIIYNFSVSVIWDCFGFRISPIEISCFKI